MTARIHETAIVEPGVSLGDGSSIWDNALVRGPGTTIGRSCIIGAKSYIAPGVAIGDRVKINGNVFVCTAVTLESGVMVAAGTIFTNDLLPRATSLILRRCEPSEADEATLPTLVCEGATIGAGSIIGCDLRIGRFAMIGMGSIVTKSIPDFALAVGQPARVVGFVDRAGRVIRRFESPPLSLTHVCADGYRYDIVDGALIDRPPADR
ncbi:MAG: N-acetyltransferase [Rhodomicrobium sp.]|nr:N-acetyltransferase [Rhodomicrobium sp.]